jgi:arabinoxylan arabinofuranohydrolase
MRRSCFEPRPNRSIIRRSQTGTPTAKATRRLTAGSTVTYVTRASAGVRTLLSRTKTVAWSGTLTGVLFYVETGAGTGNIYIDDAQLCPYRSHLQDKM